MRKLYEMSRVARYIDNGPMEGFWRLMKQEMYYGKKYKTKGELILEKGVKKGSDLSLIHICTTRRKIRASNMSTYHSVNIKNSIIHR